ncbi:MAG: hypothetical protein M1272_07850 [Firmicutes bacterium]|nr:hypothetical protein [Bacillota bacterium]
MQHHLIQVIGDATPPENIVCPNCGERGAFRLFWLGDLSQSFSQTATGERAGYDSHDNEGDFLNLEIQIGCANCDVIVMERPVTITVSPWQYGPPKDDSVPPQPAQQCWHVHGQYSDSSEDHYYDWVLMPADWDEDQVREALVEQAEKDDDDRLAELLAEDAMLEKRDHVMVNGQLYVPGKTINAVYR